MKNKEPLYRKENTKARGNHHQSGSDAKYDRNTKKGMSTKMKQGKERGLDYTPLFRFLLSKVGKKWDDVFSEAVSRLDKQEPIFWMVKINEEPLTTFEKLHGDSDNFRFENSNWSRLIVDENNILQLKNPNLKNEDFEPSCPCCTQTFNGKVLTKKYTFKR